MEQLKKLKTSSDDESSTASSSWGHNIRPEKMVDGKEEPVSSRKIQKAEREKIRRDKLKKHVFELGDALDPNRPKSDKASILIDTVQILKDLMTQVDRLKAEYVTLSQESRELNQDKSELREENSSLKSDIEILSAQCQHRVMVPWIPHYAYPLPVVAITQGQVSTLPSLLNGTQTPSPLPNPSTTFMPYLAASLGPKMERKDDVGLELELKIHASSSAHDASGKEEKGNSTVTASSSNSYYSSSHAVQDCSP
ncbi:PREDICTED: transcription factor bHLH11-like isoform X2 [Brassica oleracea var. oleracea]|uniref:transcription factor bHLH11-like isoform X2 n=1 Tax=Brassica oleracea var. oleracea TaxID=109376 RepID=UPI0006A73C73|nr:PREDICTED: transcription factor bHLH11-like isoform X2 [Brassica oleracea var. oleracea]